MTPGRALAERVALEIMRASSSTPPKMWGVSGEEFSLLYDWAFYESEYGPVCLDVDRTNIAIRGVPVVPVRPCGPIRPV